MPPERPRRRPQPQEPQRPTKDAPAPRHTRPPSLKVDADRFPALDRHPELERALRIRQAILQGHPRDTAIRLAEEAMGERAPHMQGIPQPRAPRAKAKPKATRRT
jgi:hypothetical protein